MNKPGIRPHKKPDDLKSQVFRFRLHPEIEAEAEVMRIIGELTGADPNYGLRQAVVAAFTYYYHNYVPDREDTVSVQQLAEIHDMLQAIGDHLQSGEYGPREAEPKQEKKRTRRGGKVEVSNEFLGSLGRFLSSGMSAEDAENGGNDD